MAGKSIELLGVYKPLWALASCSALVILLTLVLPINVLQERQLHEDLGHQLKPKDKLLGGLLTTTTAASDEEGSCLSRYQAASYWRSSHHNPPSPHLLEKLRAYESLHKRCGPYTLGYNRSTEMLKLNKTGEHLECKYVVWIAEAGLGNRMISIVSGFLYAILNSKVLLLSYGEDFKDLFCEPFHDTTWALPSDFPIRDFWRFWGDAAPLSFGKLLKNKVIDIGMNSTGRATVLLPFSYVHIMHDSGDMDRMFFCDEAQILLRKIPWVFVRANNYYAPGFFLAHQYRAELDQLFPEKDTVFHHLARYLLHPTNSPWGQITRYYNAYLANADSRLGIQIRNLSFASASFEDRLAQVVNCTMEENLLPRIDLDGSAQKNSSGSHSLLLLKKAILVVSLDIGYYERIKNMYYEHPTSNGELIGVYQPSHEEQQRTSERSHNVKALSEMYLLSFSDVLVTSELSTFGYVAQGLGGLKSWIVKTPGRKKDKSSCRKAMSIEPCFLNPPHCDCKTMEYKDPTSVVPYVRHCEDPWGVKLFD